MTKRPCCVLVLAAILAGCAGIPVPDPVPELNYAALSCAQLEIELASEITQLDLSQRLLLFEQSIPNGQPWIQENAIAQTRVNIAAIIEAVRVQGCSS